MSRRRSSMTLVMRMGAVAGAVALFGASEALAISRSEVMARAQAFAYHPWTCGEQNLTASCSAGYESVYVPGDHVGLPYDWGGYMELAEFDKGILAGKGAGSYPKNGILSCTVGLDCSGFVSKAWGIGHYTTSNLASVASAIGADALLAGDIFNQAGYHVTLFSSFLANGEPAMYEALGYNVHYNVTGGWSHVDGYTPRRHGKIKGTAAVATEVEGEAAIEGAAAIGGAAAIEGAAAIGGTAVSPIVIDGFPYTDTRNTEDAPSGVLDGCGAGPEKLEGGAGYVYQVTFDRPGTLTAAISDDAGVDVDVHLSTSMSTGACVARHDSILTVEVDCGTYYLVAEAPGGAGEVAGLYALTAAFTPAGGVCGGSSFRP